MTLLAKHLQFIQNGTISILDSAINHSLYCPINLSTTNIELNNYNIQNPTQCQLYITSILRKNNAEVAYGGYLEKRNIYGDKLSFTSGERPRNIHLGMDFWTVAGTKVIVPLDGWIHSFQNNKTKGDYGPTIVLKHEFSDFTFHTLYGHLSLKSLENIHVGMPLKKGNILGAIGTTDINVNYAPHLHFQIIKDMEGNLGDYPGVCTFDSLAYYSKNCPDPNLILGIGG